MSEANIQIIASTVADTQDYGIYRVLCNRPEQAYMMLKENGVNVNLTEVMALCIDDEPGQASTAIQALSDAGIGILYMYSFLWKGKGVLVLRTEESEKASEVVARNRIMQMSAADFCC